jgi:hypothetical protein
VIVESVQVTPAPPSTAKFDAVPNDGALCANAGDAPAISAAIPNKHAVSDFVLGLNVLLNIFNSFSLSIDLNGRDAWPTLFWARIPIR